MPALSFARGAMGGAQLAMSLMDFRRRGELMERQERRQEEAHGLRMQAGQQQLEQSAERHEWTRTNQELSNRIRSLQLEDLETEEQNRRLLAYLRVFDAYDGLRKDDPDLDDDRIRDAGQAATELFTPLIQQEGGPERRITDIIPVEEGLTLELDDQYPMTQRRSSDPDDPVAVIPWHHAFSAIEDMGEKFTPLMDRFAGVVEEFGYDPSDREGRQMMIDLVRAELGDTSGLDARASRAEEESKHSRAMQLEAFKSSLRLREKVGEQLAKNGGGRYSEADIERHRSAADRAFRNVTAKAFDETWIAEPGRAAALATTQQVMGETINLYQQAGLDVPVTEIGSAAGRIMAQAENRFPTILWSTAEEQAREEIKEEYGNRGTTPQMVQQRALEIQNEAADALYGYTRTALAQLFPVHRQVLGPERGAETPEGQRGEGRQSSPSRGGDQVPTTGPGRPNAQAVREAPPATAGRAPSREQGGGESPERPSQRRVLPQERDTVGAAIGRSIRSGEAIDTAKAVAARAPHPAAHSLKMGRWAARAVGRPIARFFKDLITAPPADLPDGVQDFGRSIEIGRTPTRESIQAAKQWAAEPANERFVRPELIEAIDYWERQLRSKEQDGSELVDTMLKDLAGI